MTAELQKTLKKNAPIPANTTKAGRRAAAVNFVKYLRDISAEENLGLTWDEITELCNEVYNLEYCKRNYQKLLSTAAPEANEASDTLLELKKERVKIADERVQNNAYLRRLAREDTIKEIAREAAAVISQSKALLTPKTSDHYTTNYDNKEAILMLSDWHYGIDCKNYWNTYNPTIARDRLAVLQDRVIEHCVEHKVRRLHVLNLADLIAGRIHLTIRLESRIDVITQIMEVSEMLAEMLATLSSYTLVDYYSCLDNHSRLEPNKADSLDLESLCRITDWYLKERLKDFNVNIHDNTFGDDIITFSCKGYSILGVHGDKDKPVHIIDSISRMTQEHFDLICTAHLHHFSCDEKNNTVVVCNGSLMGTDTFAKNLRLSSMPSQNLIIVSDRSVCDVIYRILV